MSIPPTIREMNCRAPESTELRSEGFLRTLVQRTSCVESESIFEMNGHQSITQTYLFQLLPSVLIEILLGWPALIEVIGRLKVLTDSTEQGTKKTEQNSFTYGCASMPRGVCGSLFRRSVNNGVQLQTYAGGTGH